MGLFNGMDCRLGCMVVIDVVIIYWFLVPDREGEPKKNPSQHYK